jgi:hypothetical protein
VCPSSDGELGGGYAFNYISLYQPEGSRPFGSPRHRWKDMIKMDLGEIGLGSWSGLRWLRIGTSSGIF